MRRKRSRTGGSATSSCGRTGESRPRAPISPRWWVPSGAVCSYTYRAGSSSWSRTPSSIQLGGTPVTRVTLATERVGDCDRGRVVGIGVLKFSGFLRSGDVVGRCQESCDVEFLVDEAVDVRADVTQTLERGQFEGVTRHLS